jgi:hypothetical protein
MSAIASFIKTQKTSLGGLRQAATQGDLENFLRQHGKSSADYKWSGFVFGTLLPYLQEEHQIGLMTSEYDELAAFMSKSLQATYFIFTEAHRQAYIGSLGPESFSEQKLRDFFNEFNATDELDVGQMMLDGIRALRDCLSALDEGSVIVLGAG